MLFENFGCSLLRRVLHDEINVQKKKKNTEYVFCNMSAAAILGVQKLLIYNTGLFDSYNFALSILTHYLLTNFGRNNECILLHSYITVAEHGRHIFLEDVCE